MKVKAALFGFVLLLCIAGCSSGTKAASSLTGKWTAQFPEPDKNAGIKEGDTSTQWTITFHKDGTFEEHASTKTMANMDRKVKGTFRQEGNRVILKGTAQISMDDGYKKTAQTEPSEMSLTIAEGKLVIENADLGNVVFKREGSRPTLEASSESAEVGDYSEAAKLIKDVEGMYGKLNSYADEGTFESSGSGFMAKEALFETRFQRPKLFRFTASAIENGKKYDTNAVWSDGSKSWIYMEMSGGSEERGIAAGLSTITVGTRTAPTLIPSLLMPSQFQRSELSRLFGGATMEPETKVDGKLCFVLKQNGVAGGTLWIEKSTLLIRKLVMSTGNAVTVYKPRPNATIPSSEFTFKAPK
ncbi:MAG: hypothetical protein KF784_05825 [Fimbriimonadaceae bacterium]|nr:hypothetical protein [Fimbriimonadaceae bacterium]